MNRTSLPVAAGIICIVVGALSLIGGFFMSLFFSVMSASTYWEGTISSENVSVIAWVLFLPYLVVCVLSIVGGVFALRRKTWGLALTGAICCLLTWWAWMAGVAAIILVVLSKKEFSHAHPADSVTVIHPPVS
jgi:hypothetical protein